MQIYIIKTVYYGKKRKKSRNSLKFNMRKFNNHNRVMVLFNNNKISKLQWGYMRQLGQHIIEIDNK